MATFPYSKFQHIDDIVLTEDIVSDFAVEMQGIKLECRLNQKVKNDYLIVTPNGAVNRKTSELPAFARWNWHGIFNSNILAIFDPALYLNDNLPIGWFAGTKYQNITAFVADTVLKVASLLDIPPNRIIFWGSSAGGYASILLAAQIGGASFISANGQTQIINYYKGHIEAYRQLFDSNATAESLAETYPEQWSAITALRSSYDKGKRTRGVIVQNTVDAKHYNEHYIQFCEHFNLPIEGGFNDKLHLYSLLFTDEKGHGPEPSEIAKKLIEEYLPKLLED